MKTNKTPKNIHILLILIFCCISILANGQSDPKVQKKLNKKFGFAQYTNDDTYIVSLRIKEVVRRGIVDNNGSELVPTIYREIYFNEDQKNYFVIGEDLTFKLIDKNSKEIDNLREENNFKFLTQKKLNVSGDKKNFQTYISVYDPINKKVAYMDTKGKLLFDFKYSFICQFDDYNRAVAIIDNKYTVIDIKGNALLDEPLPLPNEKEYDVSSMTNFYNHINSNKAGCIFQSPYMEMSPNNDEVLKYNSDKKMWGLYNFINKKDLLPPIITKTEYSKKDDEIYWGFFQNSESKRVYSTKLQSYIPELDSLSAIFKVGIGKEIFEVAYMNGTRNYYNKTNNNMLFSRDMTGAISLGKSGNYNLYSIYFKNNTNGLFDMDSMKWYIEPKYKLGINFATDYTGRYLMTKSIEDKAGIIKVVPFEIIVPFEYIQKDVQQSKDITGNLLENSTVFGMQIFVNDTEHLLYHHSAAHKEPEMLLKASNIIKAYGFWPLVYIHEGKKCIDNKCSEIIEHIFKYNETSKTYVLSSSKKI